ncbi:MAG: hypothetical protein ACRD1V_16590 [Vicinamibacterales bacterium]
MAACPLCSERKTKRACPALGRDICAVCCATKRLVEISCPPTCQYLSTARAHPAAVVQRQQERDLRFLVAGVTDLSETQYRLLLVLQGEVLRFAKEALPPMVDADVADAAAAVAATIETSQKGIIYEHRAPGIPAQRAAAELARVIAEIAKNAGADIARLERDAAVALRALERMVRRAESDLPDAADPRASWLAFAARLVRASGADAAHADTPAPGDDGGAPRIVIP